MDPLTHSLVGGLAAKTAGVPRRRLWIVVFLGSFPDWDFVFNLFGGWAYPLWHRGISHSLVGILFQTLFFAWVLSRWDPGPFRVRAFHYSLPLFLHVLCDYVTSYGVPLLAPFSYKSFSADLTVNLNLIPIAFMTSGFLYIYLSKQQGWRAVSPMWVAWGLYFLLAFTGKAYATAFFGPHEGSVVTLPSVSNPFEWRAIRVDAEAHAYEHYYVNLMTRKKEKKGAYPAPNGDFPVRSSLRSREVQKFLKNDRWPVVRITPVERGWSVEWGTLIFSVNGAVRGKVEVWVDQEGRILSQRKIVRFWSPQS